MKRINIIAVFLVLFALIGCNYSSGSEKVNYGKARDKAHDIAIQNDLKNLQLQVDMFYNQNMKYPESVEELKEFAGGLKLDAPDGGTYEYEIDTHKFVHIKKD